MRTTISRTLGHRVLARLRVEGAPIPARAVLVFTRAGRRQLEAGAWRWRLELRGEPLPIGGRHSMADMLLASSYQWSTDSNGNTTHRTPNRG